MTATTDTTNERIRLILTHALADIEAVDGGADEQSKLAAARRRLRSVDALLTFRLRTLAEATA